MPLTRDKKQKIMAAGLGVVLVLVVFFQFFYEGGETATPPPWTAAAGRARNAFAVCAGDSARCSD